MRTVRSPATVLQVVLDKELRLQMMCQQFIQSRTACTKGVEWGHPDP